MGILASILGQWRFGLYGLAAAGLLILGWTVNGWRMDAGLLKDARAALAAEQTRNIAAQVAQLRVGFQVEAAHETINTTYFLNLKKVPVYVADNRNCDLGPDAVSLLNSANRLPGPAGTTPEEGSGAPGRPGTLTAAGGG